MITATPAVAALLAPCAATVTARSFTLTVTSGGLTTSTTITWLGIVVPPVPCVLNCAPPVVDSNGTVSGGGWWTVSGSKHRLAASAAHSAGSTTSSGELSYDDKNGTTVTETYLLDGADDLHWIVRLKQKKADPVMVERVFSRETGAANR